jgi:hypothetical protein
MFSGELGHTDKGRWVLKRDFSEASSGIRLRRNTHQEARGN